MSQPIINLQLRHREIELKFLSFSEADLRLAVDFINALSYETVSLRGWLVPYVPLATDHFALPLPQHADADDFSIWLVDELQDLELSGDVLPHIRPMGGYKRTSG